MKHINVGFSAWVCGVLVFGAVGIVGVHQLQSSRISAMLLRRARAAEAAGERPAAIRFLTRYLLFTPDDLNEQTKLALMLAEQATRPAEFRRVFFLMDRILRTDPTREPVQRRLVDVAMHLHRWDDARQHLDRLLAAHPEDAALLEQSALLAEAQHDFDKAAVAWLHAIKQDGKQVRYYEHLAFLLRKQLNAPARADEVMLKLVSANPDDSLARVVRARYLLRNAGRIEARTDIEAALKLAPNDIDVLLTAADVFNLPATREQARGYLEQARSRYPERERVWAALAAFELEVGRRREAVEFLRKGLEVNPASRDLQWDLANVFIDLGDSTAARGLIVELEKTRLPTGGLDYLHARLSLSENNYADAARRLARVRTQPDVATALAREVNLLFGMCCEKLERPDQALEAYQRVVVGDPGSLPARTGLISALAALGRLDEAIEAQKQVLKLPAVPADGWCNLARLQLIRNLKVGPKQQQWKELLATLDHALTLPTGQEEALLLKAQALLCQGKFDDARRLLEAALSQGPRPGLFAGLAYLEVKQQHFEQADEYLRQAAALDPKSLATKLATVRCYVAAPPELAAPRLLALLADVPTLPRAERQPLAIAIAEAYTTLNRFAEAEGVYAGLSRDEPGNVPLLVVRAELAFQMNNETLLDEAVELVTKLGADHADEHRFISGLRLLAQARRGDKAAVSPARSLFAELTRQRPSWTAALFYQAYLEELAGRPDQAIALYRRLYDAGEPEPLLAERIARLLYQQKRIDEADVLLTRLTERLPGDKGLTRLATELSLARRNYTRAVQLAATTVSGDQVTPGDRLWLARVYWQAGAIERAAATFEDVVRTAPGRSDGWLALVGFYTTTRQTEQASAALRRAEAALKADATPATLARLYHLAGRLDLAMQHYSRALQAAPEDLALRQAAAKFYLELKQPRLATPLLRGLLTVGDKLPPAEQAEVRRQLAGALAQTGGPRGCREALDLLDQNAPGTPPNKAPLPDRRTRIAVLTALPTEANRRQAIELLDSLRGTTALTVEDRFLLAQLQLEAHQWPAYRQEMLALLGEQTTNPTFLAHFTQQLLLRQELGEVQLWLDRLTRLAPQAPKTIEITTRLLQAQKRPEQAVAYLERELPTDAATPETRARLAQVAVLLDELKSPKAEPAYRLLVQALPGRFALLAGYLARQQRLDEALTLCRSQLADQGVEVVCPAAVGLLRGPGPTAPQLEQVEGMLKEALTVRPRSTALLMARAELRDIQGRFDDAAADYRAVLDIEPTHVVALNNLAWLSAHRPGQEKDALTLIEQAIDQNGPRPELVDTRASVYLALGRTGPAIQDLSDVTKDQPSAFRWLRLAKAHLDAADRDAAQQALARARLAGLDLGRLHPLEKAEAQAVIRRLEQ